MLHNDTIINLLNIMNKKIIISVIVLILIVLGIYFFNNKQNSAKQDIVKVGVVLPLSGELGALGESVKNSMQMSLNDLENKNIELVFEDGQFDSKIALSAYNKLQTVDNVDIIIGLDSSTLEAIKPIINKTDELMFTVGNEATIENDNVFEIIPWATELFKVLGQEVNKKYKNVAVVYATDWQLAEANKKQFYAGIGDTKYTEIAISSNSDTRTEVTKMLSQDFDSYTLFLPLEQGSKFLNEVSKQKGDKNIQLICDGNIELTIGDYLQKVNDDSVFNNCISTMITDTTNEIYTAKYKELYNAEPNFLGVYGYDAVQIVSKYLAGKDKEDWKSVLESKKFEHMGMSGKILFDNTGSRILESDVKVFKDGKFVKVTE
jgi:branched-chain amino acid transport system substrate-binding protein